MNVYKDGGIGCAYTEKQNALNAGESRDAILNRYILAPEPENKPKPAREWWVVKYKKAQDPFAIFYSKVLAEERLQQSQRNNPDGYEFEVVHVREVEK